MVSGAEGKIAEVIIKQAVPKVTDYVRMLWSGKKFLILGPARAGKTSFLTYLEHLILPLEKQTGSTVGVHTGHDRTLKLGPNGTLELRVRKPRDVAGQMPIHHIEYIKDYKPHCIIVVLDATTFWGFPASASSLEWFRQFCPLLNTLLISNPKVVARLKAMTVIINKWDRVEAKDDKEDEDNRKLFESYIRDILDESLQNRFYEPGGKRAIDVLPCALAKTRLGDRLAKELVQSIAQTLDSAE